MPHEHVMKIAKVNIEFDETNAIIDNDNQEDDDNVTEPPPGTEILPPSMH